MHFFRFQSEYMNRKKQPSRKPRELIDQFLPHPKVPFQEAVIEDLLDPDFCVRGFRWEKKLEKKNRVISIFQ